MSLTHSDLLKLKRWNTPTIYNGWEQITKSDIAADAFNLEETHDFMPQMGPMVGYAVTVVIEPSNGSHKENANAGSDYRKYVASVPGPKIVVVQDRDKPQVIGSHRGEVNSNTHRALGCVGTITDGAIRDVDEMTNAGFKAIARSTMCRPCLRGSQGIGTVKSKCSAEDSAVNSSMRISTTFQFERGQEALLDASLFMDENECNTVIAAARSCAGLDSESALNALIRLPKLLGKRREKFNREGEW